MTGQSQSAPHETPWTLSARLSAFGAGLRREEIRWVTIPLLTFLATRLLIGWAGYASEVAIPGVDSPDYWHYAPDNIFFDVWARWDSRAILAPSQEGYAYIPGQMSNVTNLPAYPLLIALLTPLLGAVPAALLISNVCLLIGLIFLYRLTLLEFHDHETAARAVLYLAIFPTAFFLNAIYTESLFLAASIAAMYFARRQLWAWAALAGVIASATRLQGALVVGMVGLEWLRTHGWGIGRITGREAWSGLWKGLRTDGHNLLIICLIPLGLISYMLFLNHYYDDPLSFLSAHAAWNRRVTGPFGFIPFIANNMQYWNIWTGNMWPSLIFDTTALLAVFALTPVIWRRLGESYALFALLSVWLPAMSDTQSISRFVAVLFPVFMILALWGRNRTVHQWLLIAFALYLGVLLSIFVNWAFIA
jgi:hypothetical protein